LPTNFAGRLMVAPGMAILCLKFWRVLRRRRRRRVRFARAHTIWELVLHIAAWDDVVLRRLTGVAVTLSGAQNFPSIPDASETAWRKALVQVQRVHEELVEAVAVFPDSRLDEIVPGKKGAHYTFYYMLQGVVQHELYHAGQIALLKKM
jgi:uncharacterized damage-inducible protein DinB